MELMQKMLLTGNVNLGNKSKITFMSSLEIKNGQVDLGNIDVLGDLIISNSNIFVSGNVDIAGCLILTNCCVEFKGGRWNTNINFNQQSFENFYNENSL